MEAEATNGRGAIMEVVAAGALVGAIIVSSVTVGRMSGPTTVTVVQVGVPITEVVGFSVVAPETALEGRPETTRPEEMTPEGSGLRPEMTEVGGTGMIHVVSMMVGEPSGPIAVKLVWMGRPEVMVPL